MLCRWGYMLLEDPEYALRETRRILKQDGTLALAAWTGPDDNLWSAAPVAHPAQARASSTSDPQGPGQFTWADPNLIDETMQAAGFIEPEIDVVDFIMRFEDFDDWWAARARSRAAASATRTSRWTSPRAAMYWPSWKTQAKPFTATRRPSGNPRKNLGRDGDRLRSPPMYYDDDADLDLLKGKTVAILGYGSQGHAHARNLKDSGVDVVVGLREDSKSVEHAKAAGLEVTSIEDASSRGDIVMVLLPDEKHHDVYEESIKDGIAPGNLLHVRARLLDPLQRGRAARRRSTSRSSPRRARATWSAASTPRAPACRA